MGSLPALRYFGSYSGCYFKPSGIMGVTHGFLASLQVFWETILLPVFRYFRIYSWFLCHSLQVFWETVLLPVFKYFGSYSRCSCQPSDVFEVLQGALASLQVFWELRMVSLPASRTRYFGVPQGALGDLNVPLKYQKIYFRLETGE